MQYPKVLPSPRYGQLPGKNEELGNSCLLTKLPAFLTMCCCRDNREQGKVAAGSKSGMSNSLCSKLAFRVPAEGWN